MKILGLLIAFVCWGCSSAPVTPPADAGTPCVDVDGGPPEDVFCIGLYANRDSAQRDPSAIAYLPGLTFWSDGAEKQRFLYLPPGAQIDTSNMDSWKFPVGTRAFKEFRVGGVLTETRLYWKRETGWVHATYIWNSTGTQATLNTSRAPTVLDGGYEIPATNLCQKCHGGAADALLGVEAVTLGLPTATGMTLASLVADGRLSVPPQATSIALPEDATGKAAAALGYLHINCSACHSARGLSGFTQFHTRLRAEEFWPDGGEPVEATDAYVTGINQDVLLATYAQAFPGAKILVPGAHDQSLAWLVAHRRGEHQMPPIVSHVVDAAGTEKLADWLDALSK